MYSSAPSAGPFGLNHNTLPYLLQQRATHAAHDRAYCFPEHGQAYTWGQLWHEVRVLAEGLLKLDIKPGDRVAVLLEGRVELILSLFAVASVGAVVVPLSPYSKLEELKTYFLDARPVALLMGTAAAQLPAASLVAHLEDAAGWVPRHVFVHGAPAPVVAPFRPFSELLDFDNRLADADFWRACAAVHAAAPSFLLYTSGTTGVPKGVLRSTASFLVADGPVAGWGGRAKTAVSRLADRYTNRFAVLSLLPLYHLGGIGMLFTSLKMANVRTVLLARFHPVVALHTVAAERCKFLIGTPYMLQAMMAAQPTQRVNLDAVLGVVFASAAVSSAIIARVTKELKNVYFFTVSYGSSEAGAVANGTCLVARQPNVVVALFLRLLRSINLLNGLIPFEAFSQMPYSICGKVDKAVEVQVRDVQTGALLPPGQPGEIIIRSHRVMRYAHAQLVQESFLEDGGWYRSGDIGYVDAQGFLIISDRIKRLISRGGEKISPVEIEGVLLRQAGVAEAFVVGVPDELYGEQIGAALVAEAGIRLDLPALRAALAATLSRFKVPKYLVELPALPVTASGKVASEEIKQLVSQKISAAQYA
jgi:fatty-acyl-CoA synthase